VPDE